MSRAEQRRDEKRSEEQRRGEERRGERGGDHKTRKRNYIEKASGVF